MKGTNLGILGTFFNRTIRVCFWLSVASLVTIWILVVLSVVLRRFLGMPIGWVVEMSEYGIVVITFLSAAWLLRVNKHPRVDFVTSHLNQGGKRLLGIVVNLLGMLVCLVLTWYAGRATWEQFQDGVVLIGTVEIPKWPLSSVIVLGSFLLSVQFLREVHMGIKGGGQNGMADRSQSDIASSGGG